MDCKTAQFSQKKLRFHTGGARLAVECKIALPRHSGVGEMQFEAVYDFSIFRAQTASGVLSPQSTCIACGWP